MKVILANVNMDPINLSGQEEKGLNEEGCHAAAAGLWGIKARYESFFAWLTRNLEDSTPI